MAGLTFDTGALIGLERRRHRIRRVFVYTSDFDDLARLQRHFRSVRVLAV
ncbi:MAG TPA: hypothetical protein VGG39_02200 [Polyangiaceae bacterium]|jgi:hypothetical protein